jgi:hypothetical protein
MKPVVQARKGFRRHVTPRKVHLEFVSTSARNVVVVGSFNAWNAESGGMTRTGHGKWIKDFRLAPGTYEYHFLVDGHWVQDPNADHSVTNADGEQNSLLSVPDGNGG